MAKDWVINSLKEGIVVFSKDGKILECNDAANTFIKSFGSQIDPEMLLRTLKKDEDSIHEVTLEGVTGNVYYEINLHHLFTSNQQKQGSVAVIHDVTEQIIGHNALIQKADLDSLTQVFNKKAIEREFTLLKDDPVCLLVIDVDKFKQINDTFGHPIGDEVLIGLTRDMKKSIRKQDLIGRIGGDEFCIVLSQCDNDLCLHLVERLQENLKKQVYNTNASLPTIEVSIGAVTDIDNSAISFNEAYRLADDALYEAKDQGRNLIVIKKYSD